MKLYFAPGTCSWSARPVARSPVLQEFVARVAARPHVQEAMNAEGLLKQSEGGGALRPPAADPRHS